MTNPILTICNATIHSGESTNLALPLPEQFSCAPLYMPIKVVKGKKPGPCLLIFSTIKGTELNGIEIVNRVMEALDPKQMAGTVIAIPVVNVYGLTHYPSTLPSGRKLEDCFPGKENGTFGERFAHVFTEEILKKADYCIELQTGGIGHTILPQVYCNFDDKQSTKLARIFQAPIITNVELQKNTLRKTTDELNIPLLVYQAGEALRFDEDAINLGVKGVLRVAAELKIIEYQSETNINSVASRESEWIIANNSGVLHSKVALGQHIFKKDLLGTITDPFGNKVLEPVISSHEGIVVGINMTPLVHEGLPIYRIALFLDAEKAEIAIEKWDKANNQENVE
jgi:predicted deacylase